MNMFRFAFSEFHIQLEWACNCLHRLGAISGMARAGTPPKWLRTWTRSPFMSSVTWISGWSKCNQNSRPAAGNFPTGIKLLPSCISDSGRRTYIGVRQIRLQHKYGYFSHSMTVDEAPVSDVNRAKNEGVTVVGMRLQPWVPRYHCIISNALQGSVILLYHDCEKQNHDCLKLRLVEMRFADHHICANTRTEHWTHEPGENRGVGEKLRPGWLIFGAKHVAPMKRPPVEREHFIVSAVNDNAGADALESYETYCGANKCSQLQKHQKK